MGRLWAGQSFTDLAMATSLDQSLWLAVKIVVSSKVLFFPTIIPCSGEESFGQLLERIDGERFAENLVEAVKIVGKGKRLGCSVKNLLTFCM